MIEIPDEEYIWSTLQNYTFYIAACTDWQPYHPHYSSRIYIPVLPIPSFTRNGLRQSDYMSKPSVLSNCHFQVIILLRGIGGDTSMRDDLFTQLQHAALIQIMQTKVNLESPLVQSTTHYPGASSRSLSLEKACAIPNSPPCISPLCKHNRKKLCFQTFRSQIRFAG